MFKFYRDTQNERLRSSQIRVNSGAASNRRFLAERDFGISTGQDQQEFQEPHRQMEALAEDPQLAPEPRGRREPVAAAGEPAAADGRKELGRQQAATHQNPDPARREQPAQNAEQDLAAQKEEKALQQPARAAQVAGQQKHEVLAGHQAPRGRAEPPGELEPAEQEPHFEHIPA